MIWKTLRKDLNLYITYLYLILVLSFSDLFAEDLFEVTSCYFPIDFTPVGDFLSMLLFAARLLYDFSCYSSMGTHWLTAFLTNWLAN